MDEFEEFAIRSYRGYTEEDSDHHLGHDRNHSHLISEKLHGCIDVTEIFPSPIDICEVKKAWYGDQSENIADCSQQCTRFGSTEAPSQGHGRCRAGPDDSAQQTTINTISRSCRTDSVKCLQRSVSATNKVIGAYRTAVISERTTSASTGDTPTSKLASVGSLATSLSSSSSSSSSPASVAEDGRSASKETDDVPSIQLAQAVYRVRSFSTDNERSVLNLGDSFKIFNRLLLLTREDNSSNVAEHLPVIQTPVLKSNTVAEESERSVLANTKKSASRLIASTRISSTISPISTTAHDGSAGINARRRFRSIGEFHDSSECSDAETGDANDERKELLKRSEDMNSSEEEEEEEESFELLRKIAFPAIPSPEDLKKRSTSGASIALRSLGCEDDGDSGSLRPTEGVSLPPEEGGEDGHWAGDSLLRVRLVGSHGVGKTTLTQQLMTSEYRPTDLVSSSDESCNCPLDNVVVVEVDDVQSVLQFIDINGEVVDPCGIRSGEGAAEADVYLVVYSVTDRSSFKYAGALLRQLSRRFPSSRSPGTPPPVAILVANKQDLVRKRVVSENSGKRLALKRHCKFIEISAFLDHRVDDLLVGILKQLQLQQLRQCALEDGEEDEEDDDFRNNAEVGCLRNVSFLRFWRRLPWAYCSHAYQPSSCDDLFV